MRSFEMLVLLLGLTIFSCRLAANGAPLWLERMVYCALVIALLQFAFEGGRWQMYPAYLAILGMSVAFAMNWAGRTGAWTGLLGLALTLAATTLCTVLPVVELPVPTGRFRIGTIKRHLVDPSRRESRAEHLDAKRELMIQAWYPTAHDGAKMFYCLREELPFRKEHLALVRTHSSANVPIESNSGRFPVLIFSPSWTGSRFQNTAQIEELASHGFIIVGIDHTYGSQVTLFPDGRMIRSVLRDWLNFSSESEFQESLHNVNIELDIRTEDTRFVLDTLERWDRNDPTGLFTGRIDRDRVGIFGHSFGGAVAAEACCRDPRFKACVDMDGCVFGQSKIAGVKQPFMVMSSGDPAPSTAELAASTGAKHRYLEFLYLDDRSIRRSLDVHGGYLLRIEGASHSNYSDSPLFTQIKRLTEAGEIDARRALRITFDYTLVFFNRYLIGQPPELVSEKDLRYQEVHLENWPRPDESN